MFRRRSAGVSVPFTCRRASAAIAVLLVMLLVMNSLAILLRNKFQKRRRDACPLQFQPLPDIACVDTRDSFRADDFRAGNLCADSPVRTARSATQLEDPVLDPVLERVTGRITYHGEDLYADYVDPIEVRRRIGMVFQKPNPFPKSIFDNVAYGRRVDGQKGNLADVVEDALTGSAPGTTRS